MESPNELRDPSCVRSEDVCRHDEVLPPRPHPSLELREVSLSSIRSTPLASDMNPQHV